MVKFFAKDANTFTKIEKTECKAFEKARSALEVGLLNFVFLSCTWEMSQNSAISSNLPVSFCLFIVKILATVAKTLTKI